MPQSIRTSTSAGAVVFAPLDGAGRAELVERRLTDAIVLGLLTDGERLPSESEMAKRFGVATVTAREALEALRDKGLVDTRRGRDGGSFVTAGRDRTRQVLDGRVRSLSRVELRDMGTYYSAIAGSCATLAADRATDDDLERVRGIALVPDEDETAARRRQGMFQLEIAALSQSARLVREELRLQSEFAPLLWLWLREPEYRSRSLDARGAVLDALAEGDAAAARERTTAHVGEAIDWLLETKTELEGEGMTLTQTDAVAVIDSTFENVFTLIEGWRLAIEQHVTAEVDVAGIDALVEKLVVPDLSRDGALIIGAGFVAQPGFIPDAPWHLAWWLGHQNTFGVTGPAKPKLRRLIAVEDEQSESFRDYTTLEWWRVPASTHERHITGPYVDYLCTDDYTLTSTMPAFRDGEMIGVVGADLYVNDIERTLLPAVRGAGRRAALVNASGRVVVASDSSRPTGSLIRREHWVDHEVVPCANGLVLLVE